MSPRLKQESRPRATPALAKRVWKGQRTPSARTVATALNQAGYRVHYTTVARWRSQGWRQVDQPDRLIEAARAKVDSAVPILTGDPNTKADELGNVSPAKLQLERLSEKELLTAAARQALVTLTLVDQELNNQLPELLSKQPMQTGVLIRSLAALCEASTNALIQALAPQLPTK
jgi:hypothetical protein